MTWPPTDNHNAMLAVVAFLFALWRGLVSRSARGVKGLFTALLGGLGVGWLAGRLAMEYGASPTLALVASALAAIVANEFLLGLIKIAADFQTNPFGFIGRLIDAWRAAKAPAPPAPPPAPVEEETP